MIRPVYACPFCSGLVHDLRRWHQCEIVDFSFVGALDEASWTLFSEVLIGMDDAWDEVSMPEIVWDNTPDSLVTITLFKWIDQVGGALRVQQMFSCEALKDPTFLVGEHIYREWHKAITTTEPPKAYRWRA